MKTNQIKCQLLLAGKPQPQQRRPVITLGKMECRQLGDGRMIQVGRIGGVNPPEVTR